MPKRSLSPYISTALSWTACMMFAFKASILIKKPWNVIFRRVNSEQWLSKVVKIQPCIRRSCLNSHFGRFLCKYTTRNRFHNASVDFEKHYCIPFAIARIQTAIAYSALFSFANALITPTVPSW